MALEIERKWRIRRLPERLLEYPIKEIEQGYLNFSPAIRVRRSRLDGKEHYSMSYKGSGLLSHEEVNLPLDRESYHSLLKKAEGIIIRKRRSLIPYGEYRIELDRFLGELEGLWIAEVEFPSVEEARRFQGPDWFSEDVTESGEYANSRLAYLGRPPASALFSQESR